MQNHMPPSNPRKRPAPGASPQITQPFPAAASQMSNSDFLRWNQGGDGTGTGNGYTDPASAAYNMSMNLGTYGGNGVAQAAFDQTNPASSTQLARRPTNRQLVHTHPPAQRYENNSDPWPQFTEDGMVDQNQNGVVEENDNVELLEERAVGAKRDAQSKRKQIPPFVQKLSSFLDESKNTELIRWSDRGDSFVVLDEDEFAKTLIPELFKHNNYASFVRQLNMYGFHKRVGLSDNSMKASERKNKSPSEYYNPYFKRGHPNLLWLINKPKVGNTKGKPPSAGSKARVKNEEADNSDEEVDIEEVYGNVPHTRAISSAPESSALQRRDVAVLQNQLTEVQQQQVAITGAISRLRKDHNQLYQQSMAFQSLHDRHENSINAILTFLATVYNRSLDGTNPQSISQMFGNVIPMDQQQQGGSVVDIGEMKAQHDQNPGNSSPHRRQQRLLMAPPAGGRALVSPSVESTPAYNTPQTGAVEELFDSPSDTTQVKIEPNQPVRQNMMNIINNTNAQARPNNNSMQFPEMLSHYENANGHSPLTSEQRNTMLNLMANQSSAPGSNNALVSPSPPLQPSLDALNYTQAEIDELVKLQNDQENRISNLKSQIEPLSPSGNIPGLTEGYFSNDNNVDSNVDLDQFLDTGAFYTGSSPLGATNSGADFNYDHFDHSAGLGGSESQFDLGMDGSDVRGGRVETAGSSEVATPEDDEVLGMGGLKSPSKRRRKN